MCKPLKNAGNDLEAFKVDEWYQFLPAVTYKYLDAEQAEERFKERDKVFNQFALKAQIQKQLNDQEERQQQETMKKGTASLVGWAYCEITKLLIFRKSKMKPVPTRRKARALREAKMAPIGQRRKAKDPRM